jgi:hypothetical protein
MGERDRARVLGWACVGEIRGKKREMRLVKNKFKTKHRPRFEN